MPLPLFKPRHTVETRSPIKTSHLIVRLAFAAYLGTLAHSLADDAKATEKESIETRIAELEAKLKDAGAGGGVEGSGIKISGYVDTSYVVNLADRSQSGPVAGSSAQNTGRVFDNAFDAFSLNAVKLTIEKSKDDSKLPAGFRVDGILGEDANVLNANKAAGALGNDSDLFLEQAYANLGIPVGSGLDLKIGKMVTLIGYEAIESSANWQFSRSDACRLSPSTQTGVTLGYTWNDTVTTTVGVINGIDALAANCGAVNYNTDFSFVGRVDVTAPKASIGDFAAFVTGLYGNDNTFATSSSSENSYIYNVGGTWTKPLGITAMTLGIDFLNRHETMVTDGVAPTQTAQADAKALTAYGKWDWNKWTSTSGRFGVTWYQTDPSSGAMDGYTLSPLVPYTASTQPGSTELYGFTLTQAFNAWKDTLVRVEWRHDWTDANNAGFGAVGVGSDDLREDQDTIAVNVVYSF